MSSSTPSVVVPAHAAEWWDAVNVTDLWDHREEGTCARVEPMPVGTTKPPGHLRFMCISDTHGAHRALSLDLAGVDVLVHAGDFSNVGRAEEVADFTAWLRALPVAYKVLIAGNHDVSFDEDVYESHLCERFEHDELADTRQMKLDLMAGQPELAAGPFPDFAEGVAYLEDSGVSIQGVRIWGSPWQPAFHNWGFNLARGAPLREKWALIPSDTQVLVTHGPPLGYGDQCQEGHRAGCADLTGTIIERVRPLWHVSGHIHEGYGQTTNGTTQFVNASSLNRAYDVNKLNAPIVFDVAHNRQACLSNAIACVC